MNPESPRTPREENEIRITAMLMGELSPDEAAALQTQIAADAELSALHARLQRAAGFVREASAFDEKSAPSAPPQPAQLSAGRRARLFAHFKGGTPAAPASVIVKPKREWKWAVPLGLAASLMALIGGAMFVNGFALRKGTRFAHGAVLSSDSDTDGFSNREEWQGRTADAKDMARSDSEATLRSYHLQSSVDEWFYSSKESASSASSTANSPSRGVAGADKDANGRAWKSQPGTIPRDSQIDKSQFAVTANSRSPELNLFGRPRISSFPQGSAAPSATPRPDVAAKFADAGESRKSGVLYLPSATPEAPVLDLFSMPIASAGGAGETGRRLGGYAISEPFSTGGKVNIPSELKPFSDAKRAERGSEQESDPASRDGVVSATSERVYFATPRLTAGNPVANPEPAPKVQLHPYARNDEHGARGPALPAGPGDATNNSGKGGKAADFDSGIGRFPDGALAGNASDWKAQPEVFSDLNQPAMPPVRAGIASADEVKNSPMPDPALAPVRLSENDQKGAYAIEGVEISADRTAGRVDPNKFPETTGGVLGTGGVTKNGNGTLVLSDASSYTGGTSVTGGTLRISAADTDADNASAKLGDVHKIKPDKERAEANPAYYAGSFWETPRVQGYFERGVAPEPDGYRGGLSSSQPTQDEFQKYPGHPSTTSLGLVLDSLPNFDGFVNYGSPIQTPSGNQTAGFTSEKLYFLTPRLMAGGRATKTVSGKPGDQKSDGERNREGEKIVGLIASWSDDDTAKVNINTARGFDLPQTDPLAISAGGANNSTAFSGVIKGTGDVTKGGTAEWQLDGTNAFTGGAAVNLGTLSVPKGNPASSTPAAPNASPDVVNISGNTRTKDKVIHRELDVASGDIFKLDTPIPAPSEHSFDFQAGLSFSIPDKTIKLNTPDSAPAVRSDRERALALQLKGGTTFDIEIHPAAESKPVSDKAISEAVDALRRKVDGDSELGGRSTEAAANREMARRISREEAGKNETAAGRTALEKKDYEAAFSHYKNASENIPAGVPAVASSHHAAAEGLADAGMKLAEQRVSEGYYASAVETLQEVLKKNPDSKQAQRLLSQIEAPKYFNKQITPQHRVKVEEVKQLFTEGKGYTDLGRYDLADGKYQEILAKDPYNQAAQKGREEVANLKMRSSRAGYDATRAIAAWEEEKESSRPVQRADRKADAKKGAQETTPKAVMEESLVAATDFGIAEQKKSGGENGTDALADVREKLGDLEAKSAVDEKPIAQAEPKALEKKIEEQRKLKDPEPVAPKPAPNPLVPQPEVRTGENAFSTFSLNVSDVAFKLAAASLERGTMPDVSTLRSEEFINAFDYRDPEAAPGAPLAFVSERARYPFAQNRDLLRLSVKTAAAGRQAGKPLNVVLLLDNSGSMERADRVRIVREGLRKLSAQLQPQDKLSIVTFARTPHLWADGVAGDKAAEATARVGEITPEGGTNLAAALDLGYKTALRHYQVGSINHVVLLTDGAANLGDVDPAALKQKVEAHRKQGIALDCFGIGWEGLNDDMLEQLSRNGDGRYGFINTPEEAATNFAGQLAGALRVAASDVKVQVEFNPKRVTAYRQVGYAKHQLTKEQFRDNTVDAAELAAAESGNALYVIEVNPRGEGDLATVRVRFKVPGTSDYREHEWPVPFTRPAAPLEESSSTLRLAATAAAFSEMLAGSPFATEVTSDRLLKLVNGVPAIYGADPRPQKLEWMIRQAKSLSGR